MPPSMRDDYLKEANAIVGDPNILINLISRRVKQLRRGQPALIETSDQLELEDVALREVIEGKISYELSEEPTWDQDKDSSTAEAP